MIQCSFSMQSSKARLLARTRWIKLLIIMLSESNSLQKITTIFYFHPYSAASHVQRINMFVETRLSSLLTCSWVATSAPSLVPLLKLEASLQRAPHKGLQPLLNATQRSQLWFKHPTTSFTVYGLYTLRGKGHMENLSDASKGQMHSDLCCDVCVRSKRAHPLLLKLLPPLLLHRNSAELLLLSLLLQPPPALLHRPLILQPCPAILLPDQLLPGR